MYDLCVYVFSACKERSYILKAVDFVFEMVIICICIYVTFHSSRVNTYVHMFWPVLNSKDGNKTFCLIEVLVSIKMRTIS